MPKMSGDGLVELKISSPGKVILFGEHAVVYGKTALAASLGLRSVLSLKELPPEISSKFCEIEMPGVGLSSRLSLEQLQESLLTAADNDDSSSSSSSNSAEDSMHSRLLKRARDYVCEHVDGSVELDQRQRCSLECLLYALARVARAEGLRLLTAFRLELTSDLPLGAGLGSSASFSVCLVAGFLLWARLRRGDCSTTVAPLDHASLRQISRHALGCERIMHGEPSGVDNEICTFGSVIEFRKAQDPKLISLTGRLAGLRVLLVNTRVARSTKSLVDRLARLHDQYPEIFDLVFESIDRLCRRVVQLVEDPSSSSSSEDANRQLSALIEINQGLLTTCQVSHPAIDSICATAKKHGLSAKLTGAGGGGFVYILVPPDVSTDKLQSVISELAAEEFSVIETSLGDSGLVIHNASIL